MLTSHCPQSPPCPPRLSDGDTISPGEPGQLFPTQTALATPPSGPESPWQREGTVPEVDQHLQQDGLRASWDRLDVKQQPGTGTWVRNH